MKYLKLHKDDYDKGGTWHFHLGNDWVYFSAQILTPVYGYTWWHLDFSINLVFLNINFDLPIWKGATK